MNIFFFCYIFFCILLIVIILLQHSQDMHIGKISTTYQKYSNNIFGSKGPNKFFIKISIIFIILFFIINIYINNLLHNINHVKEIINYTSSIT